MGRNDIGSVRRDLSGPSELATSDHRHGDTGEPFTADPVQKLGGGFTAIRTFQRAIHRSGVAYILERDLQEIKP
jgi:hypothetical protein